MTTPRAPLAISLAVALAACNGSGGNASPVSEGEAAALDEAAKMLDEKRLPEGALPEFDAPEVDAPAPTPTDTNDPATR